MPASRALRLIVLSLGLTAAGTASAQQAPSLVVDVATGKVLHAEKATDPWFPASVTKLMTAYVALHEAREGRARLDEVVTLTENAAAMPPSKMGFKPGTELTLDNALKIIMVKSANDVSVAIAETLGGSVEGFADMMNVQAQRLGMRESRFVNPHGLPDERQQTSARDMAILARALIQEFPEHESLFKIGAIQFGRRVMRNHNGLMGRYPGADGMKTGFICSSGFNVVASASQNGRRLITVVFGSRNANDRTLKAAELFDRGFASGPGLFSPTLASLPSSAAAAPVNMRPVICERGSMPGEDDSPTGESFTASSSLPNLMASTNAMAFAGTSVAPKTVLGPRAPLQPIPVWIGRTPPAAGTAVAETGEAEEAAPKPAKAKRAARPAVAAAPARPAVAAVTPPPAIAKPAPKPAPKAAEKPKAPVKATASVEAKPKPAPARKLEAKAPDAKPEPKKAQAKEPQAKDTQAKSAAKPAAKPAPKATAKAKADD